MIILDTTSKIFRVALGGSTTTNPVECIAHYDERSSVSLVSGSNALTVNSTSPIDLVAAPASGKWRDVVESEIYNADTVAQTIYPQIFDGSNTTILKRVLLQPGYTLHYGAGYWYVTDTNGSIISNSPVHILLDGTQNSDTEAGNVSRGDIAVGNSTPKWARLAKGASGTIVSANANDTLFRTLLALFNEGMAGTSFPGSPSDKDPFFRTDLDMWCFWNAASSNWLTIEQYLICGLYVSTTVSAPSPFVPIRTDYTPYITRVVSDDQVITTNDGSNYWTVAVRFLNAGYTLATNVQSYDTSGDTVGTFVLHESAPLVNKPTNNVLANINATIHGSPGKLSVGSTIYYRLVIA